MFSSHNIIFDYGCFVVDTGPFVAELLYNVNLKNTRHNNIKKQFSKMFTIFFDSV